MCVGYETCTLMMRDVLRARMCAKAPMSLPTFSALIFDPGPGSSSEIVASARTAPRCYPSRIHTPSTMSRNGNLVFISRNPACATPAIFEKNMRTHTELLGGVYVEHPAVDYQQKHNNRTLRGFWLRKINRSLFMNAPKYKSYLLVVLLCVYT